MSASQVSVLMPSYRDHGLVERSLPRILDRSTRDLEVVVLNSDPAQAAQLQSTCVRSRTRECVWSISSSAFAKAINLGIEATTGDFVFANRPLRLERLRRRDARLLLSPSSSRRCDGQDPALRPRCRPRPMSSTRRVTSSAVIAASSTGERTSETRAVRPRGSGLRRQRRSLVARRAALESIRVGGEYLDESFDMYKEDVDLCWRLRLAGWECWHVPTVAYHANESRTRQGDVPLCTAGVPRAAANKPPSIRINSMKNQWLMLIKNE